MVRILLLLLIASQLSAQSVSEYYQQADSAYQRQDYKTYLDMLRKADSILPYHPTINYKLAGALALNGRPEEAVDRLLKGFSLTPPSTPGQIKPFSLSRKRSEMN